MQRRDKTKPHQAGEGEVAVFALLFFPCMETAFPSRIDHLQYMYSAAYPGVSLVQNLEREEICPHRKV